MTRVLLGEGDDAFDSGGALEDGDSSGEGCGVAEGDAVEGRVKRSRVRV